MNRPADLSPVSTSPPARRLRLHAGAGILALVLAPLAVRGMLIENGLNVQTLSSNPNAVYSYSAAVGDGNHAEGGNSLAVGTGNHTRGANAFAAGRQNNSFGENAFTAGVSNKVWGDYGNFAAGHDNYINGSSNGAIGGSNSIHTDGNGGKYCFAWGAGNTIDVKAYNATAGGHYNIVYSKYGSAIGTVLVNRSYASVVLGWYNAPFGTEETEMESAGQSWRPQDPVLVVGNGSAAGVRSNALVVTKSGMTHIEVPPKGGISMGAYTSR